MMDTPICNFVQSYARSDALRMHMPGHKGMPILGIEQLDITEIDGADSLYEAEGIIKESEENASRIFGCPTYYSTEGSSQCIRAMLYLCMLAAKQNQKKPMIWAGRNAHKTFLSAVALLDIDVSWLYPKQTENYLSCTVSADELEELLKQAVEKPTAVYLTNPDYLGNMIDIKGIAKVCHKYGVLLSVDNAHGAYLKFLNSSLHPIDLGADICCDSAHKTLPVLTGGAYLHLSNETPKWLLGEVKNALALFGSTSPSYLILQSLDAANTYLTGYPQQLDHFIPMVTKLKRNLMSRGYCLYGKEPLKITIEAKKYGYKGKELARILLKKNIVCEFADPDYLVLMITLQTGEDGLQCLENALLTIPPKPPIMEPMPEFGKGEQVLSIREAVFSPSKTIPISESRGRILAATTVGCPPAVPILVCGERIDDHAVSCFQYYGIEECEIVMKDQE